MSFISGSGIITGNAGEIIVGTITTYNAFPNAVSQNVSSITLPTGKWIVVSNTSIYNTGNTTISNVVIQFDSIVQAQTATTSLLPAGGITTYNFTEIVLVPDDDVITYNCQMEMVWATGTGPEVNEGLVNNSAKLFAIKIA